MDENNIISGHTYLISEKYQSSGVRTPVTILNITETSYHLRWNHDNTDGFTWQSKISFHAGYKIFEDITNYNIYPLEKAIEKSDKFDYTFDFNQLYIQCTKCNGSGYLPDTSSTAGQKLCPFCNGSGRVFSI